MGFTNDDPTIQDVITKYGPEIFGVEPRVYAKNDRGSHDYHFNNTKAVTAFYEKLGLKPCKAAGKQFGPLVRTLDKDGIRAVLQGYIDCECTITDVGCIVISSASWRLLTDVKLALQVHFGIISVLRELDVAEYAQNDYWSLTMSGEEAARYVEKVGFLSKIRQAEADRWLEKERNPNIDVIPGLGGLLSAIHGSSETSREHVVLVRDYKGENPRANVTYQRLERILDATWSDTLALERLRQVHDARYFYDEVVSVTEVEAEPAFDFDMPDSHTYILNGFATRNSADRVACSLATAA
jgi:replicative DNA helicase Mcm